MPADVVSRNTLIAFRKVRGQLGRAAGSGHAALGVDDDIVRLDQAGFDERRQGRMALVG